jgi:hypothetical protein
MPFWWEENMEAEFLYDEALLSLIPYMAKAVAEDRRHVESKYDPITATAIIFLTSPLQLALTEVGAMLFQGRANMVYPYALMSDRQRSFLRNCIHKNTEWNIYNEALMFKRSKNEQPRTVKQSSVLIALCSKVLSAKVKKDRRPRLALCNIILQRVQGYVAIDKQVQKELNEWLASRTDVLQDAAKNVDPSI